MIVWIAAVVVIAGGHATIVYGAMSHAARSHFKITLFKLASISTLINLKSAKTLGLTLPSGLLGIADEVIE